MVLTGFLISILTGGYEFIYRWGYLGMFLFNFLETATISLFPLPTSFFVFSFGKIVNPFLLGVISGFGGAIGSVFAYILGRGFKDVIERKYGKYLERTRRNFDKYKAIWWIVIANFIPLGGGVIAVFCGIIRFDLKRFFIAVLLSKIAYNLILSYSGYYSVTWLLDLFQFNLPSLI